ncbi:hypothetical protein SUGI_0043470 [Cryptomeria japonica]|nr:hypothetical protein SUGI_0043470 [Cryptomeria japonica]
MGRLLLTVTILAWAVPISMLVNRIVTDPYMDEIFHAPQAQRYCKGDFKTWDPMITTLPGLYYVSLAYVAPLFPWVQWAGIVSSFQDLCSTAILRSVNIALAVICCLLFHDILIELRPNAYTKYATRWAFVFSLYPLHWFFTFLFYTDVGSTTAVMAMYLACLKRSYWLSALLGCLAIIFRQTNVVWMAFVACIGVVQYTEKFGGEYTVAMKNNILFNPLSETSDGNSKAVHTYLRHRQNVNSKKIASNTLSDENLHHTRSKYSGVVGELHVLAYNLWWQKWGILTNFFPFLLVLMAFSAFVIYNGSIVVGAKDAHAVSPHFAQILYFGLASAVALAPLHFNIDQAVALHQSFMKGRTRFIICCLLSLVAGFVCVRFFSLVHPYLLADNRHYPFYIWRRVIQTHWLMKYLLIPLYVYSWWSIFHVLGKAQKKIWLFLFFFAAVGVLTVPLGS